MLNKFSRAGYSRWQSLFVPNRQFFLRWLPLICIVAIAFTITFQFLRFKFLVATPGNDFATHLAMAENFLLALRAGQFVPILQIPPDADIPNSALFQYYGVMTGLIALPGMLLSFSSLKSLTVGIFLFRIGGAAGVYWVGKLLGGNRKVSLLSSLIYFMSPYVISNLYGRMAIPEALAHCEIPFLVAGMLLGLKGRVVAGAATISATIFMIALTHPIFLLYGCLMIVLAMLVSMSKRMIVTSAMGMVSGILLSAFHWYPIFLSNSLFIARFSSTSPYYYRNFTSWRGMFGMPENLYDTYQRIAATYQDVQLNVDMKSLYLTPSWFTVPAILGLIFLLFRKDKIREKAILLVLNIVFLLLSFAVGNIYKYMPHIAWNVQFPYRLLSFVALFTACAFPLLLPKIRNLWFAVLAFLAIFPIIPILQISYNEPLAISPDYVLSRQFANYDYILRDPDSVIEWPDQIIDYALHFLPQGNGKEMPPALKPNNVVATTFRNFASTQYVKIKGDVDSTSDTVDVWLENPDNPLLKSNVQKISKGSFSLTFALPQNNADYRLVTEPKLKTVESTDVGTIIRLNLVDGIPSHFYRRADASQIPNELRIRGVNTYKTQVIDWWFAKPSDPDTAVTGKLNIPPGEFNMVLPFPATADDYILMSSDLSTRSQASASPSEKMIVKYAEIVPKSTTTLPRIIYDFVESQPSRGYTRKFVVKKSAWWTPDGRTDEPGSVELFTAYNPFFTFTQNGRVLKARPDEKALTIVETNDLTHEIVAKYRLPIVSYLLTILGLFTVFLFVRYSRRDLQRNTIAPQKNTVDDVN